MRSGVLYNSCPRDLGHLNGELGSTPNSKLIKLYRPPESCEGLHGKPSVKSIVCKEENL